MNICSEQTDPGTPLPKFQSGICDEEKRKNGISWLSTTQLKNLAQNFGQTQTPYGFT
jgi:hypothetical protein